MRITPDYIVGLVDGEGCFEIVAKKKRSFGYQIVPWFVLCQYGKEGEKLIKKVKNFLKIGRVYTYPPRKNERQKKIVWMVINLEDLKKLRTFFREHLPIGKRRLFEVWCHGVSIYEKMLKTKDKSKKRRLLLELASLREDTRSLFIRKGRRKISLEMIREAHGSKLHARTNVSRGAEDA